MTESRKDSIDFSFHFLSFFLLYMVHVGKKSFQGAKLIKISAEQIALMKRFLKRQRESSASFSANGQKIKRFVIDDCPRKDNKCERLPNAILFSFSIWDQNIRVEI